VVGVFALIAAACTGVMGFENTTNEKMAKGAKVGKNFIVNTVECVKIR
jgi:hypothetical protein